MPIRPFKHNEYERFIVQVGWVQPAVACSVRQEDTKRGDAVNGEHTTAAWGYEQTGGTSLPPAFTASNLCSIVTWPAPPPPPPPPPPPLHLPLQAYPYYASCASMMVGFLAVGAFFLYTKP